MRNKWFIISSVILLLLIVRLGFKQLDKYSAERNWYVESLNYEFTAVVDSIEFFNNRGGGFLFCKLKGGRTLSPTLEDSLLDQLEDFQILRFMFFRKDGRAAKLSWETQKYQVGDSIYVSSQQNIFRITRNRKILRGKKQRKNYMRKCSS